MMQRAVAMEISGQRLRRHRRCWHGALKSQRSLVEDSLGAWIVEAPRFVNCGQVECRTKRDRGSFAASQTDVRANPAGVRVAVTERQAV